MKPFLLLSQLFNTIVAGEFHDILPIPRPRIVHIVQTNTQKKGPDAPALMKFSHKYQATVAGFFTISSSLQVK